MPQKPLGNKQVFQLPVITWEFSACRGEALICLQLQQKAVSKQDPYPAAVASIFLA